MIAIIVMYNQITEFVTYNMDGVLNSTAAAAPPRNVVATVQNSTAISVEWDGIERCEDANGIIVG